MVIGLREVKTTASAITGSFARDYAGLARTSNGNSRSLLDDKEQTTTKATATAKYRDLSTALLTMRL
jgi:hypothetical protein